MQDNARTTYIESLGVYLPSTEVSSETRAAGVKTRIRIPLERFTGIKSTRHVQKDEYSIDLACRAIERCLRNSSFRAEDVGLLIACNISKYDQPGFVFPIEPNTATSLRKALGFKNALAFDLSNACAGIFTAILVADCLLHQTDIKTAVIVSGEYISHLAETAQREISSFSDSRLACLTLGDAGAAVLLARSPDAKIGFQHIGIHTLGAHSWLCRSVPTTEGAIMFTESAELLRVGTPEVANQFTRSLRENGWGLDTIDHLIPHQISKRAVDGFLRHVNAGLNGSGLPARKVINNLAKRGNTATTSHMVALHDHIENERIGPGDRLAFVMAASGLTVGTALYVIDELPTRLRKDQAADKAAAGRGETPTPTAPSGGGAVSIASIATTRGRRQTPSSTEEMALQTAEDCLAQAPCDRQDIGVLIFAGVFKSGFVGEPSYASMLAGKLLPHAETCNGGGTPLAFDLHDGANGFLTACEILRSMTARRKIRAGLVIAAEFDNNRLLPGYPGLGIAEIASAAVVMPPSGPGPQISNCRSFSFDEHADSFRANLVCISPAHVKLQVQQDYEARLRSSILRALKCYLPSTGRTLADFHEFYFPQVSSAFLTALGDELQIPRQRIVDVAGAGDLYTSSLPCVIEHVMQSGRGQSERVCLAVSAGPGINVGCAIIGT